MLEDNKQLTLMITGTTVDASSGTPSTIVTTFFATPGSELPPSWPFSAASATSAVVGANSNTYTSSHKIAKGPLIGGVITGFLVLVALTATCLVYLHKGKQKRGQQQQMARVDVVAVATQDRTSADCRPRASSLASSAASDGISEFHIRHATAVRYQHCGPKAIGPRVQTSWSSGERAARVQGPKESSDGVMKIAGSVVGKTGGNAEQSST